MKKWYQTMPAWAGVGEKGKVIGRHRGTLATQRAARRRLAMATSPLLEILEPRQLLSTAGSVDTTYGTGGLAFGPYLFGGIVQTGHQTAVQSDGKIVEVANSDSAPMSSDYEVARYTTGGVLDTTFGSGGAVQTDFAGNTDMGQAIAVQSDGKIVVVGTTVFIDSGGVQVQGVGVVRYNTDGSLDTTFGTGGKAMFDMNGGGCTFAREVLIQSDGKILISGQCNNEAMIMRLTSAGALDTSFGSGGIVLSTLSASSQANAMAIMSNGDIIAGGDAADPLGGWNDAALFCYTSSGTPDTTFNGTGAMEVTLGGYGSNSTINDLTIENGKILVAGAGYLGADIGALARFNPDGTIDTTFNGTGVINFVSGGPMQSVAVQPDGQIVSGAFQSFEVLRFSPSGALDTSFGNSGYASYSTTIDATSMVISDGTIVVGGLSPSGMFELRYLLTPPPTAVIAAPSYSVASQGSVTFSAVGSSDPMGEALTYAWDTNYNGSTFNPTLTGINPTFSAVGISGNTTRQLALQVTDANGASSPIVTKPLTINLVVPVVNTSASANTVSETTPVTVSGTASDVDPTDTFTYDWHVTSTNGQTIADGSTLNWGFTPNAAGAYTATLTATDIFSQHVSSSQVITVTHIAPTVSISAPAPYASRGDAYILNLSAVETGAETINYWTVNWGDGTVQTVMGNPSSTAHIYLSPGSFTISASATDSLGTTNSSNTISSAAAAGIYYDLAAAYHSAAASINNAASGNVVDNNSSTEWTSGNVTSNPGQWVYVDLGSAYNISDIKLNWDSAYAGTYKIRISNDSVNWNDLSSVQTGAAGLVDVGSLNGTGRYLLIDMLSLSAGNTGYALKDVYVYGSDDLATNRPVYASSDQSTVGYTVDTNNATSWTSSSAVNQWVFMDLGEVYNIQGAKVSFAGDLPTNYCIYTSSDESNWTQISSFVGANSGLNTITGLNGNGRYVMLSMPSCANGADIKVSDFEVNATYDLAAARPVTVSSGSNALNAVDQNQTTSWLSTATGTQSIYTDLGASFNVTRVTLNFAGANYPSAFQIQTSTNATTWSTIYSTTTFTGGTSDLGGIYGDGRYVRIYMTAGAGTCYALNEFTVYGSANLALMRPMTASTNAANHGAPYASDQDPTTSWQSTAAGTQWLTTDLGSSFSVTNVTINFDAAYAGTYSIAISNDNSTWTTLTTVTGGHPGINQIGGLSGTGRYVKLTMTSGPSGYYQIDDLYIFGH
ncbi:MAG TPA: discoidin domain-containing protein [Tepidisphaeraceae bacterium]|nr:discoidin domain-containing protein [Tepidisphaeraceae bacterium]